VSLILGLGQRYSAFASTMGKVALLSGRTVVEHVLVNQLANRTHAATDTNFIAKNSLHLDYVVYQFH